MLHRDKETGCCSNTGKSKLEFSGWQKCYTGTETGWGMNTEKSKSGILRLKKMVH